MRKNRGKELLAIAFLMVLTCCFCACQNEDYPEKSELTILWATGMPAFSVQNAVHSLMMATGMP